MADDDPETDLPWLVNDTLRGDARAKAGAHATRTPSAQQDRVFLQALRRGVQATAQPGPGELGFARLLLKIKSEEQEGAGDPAPAQSEGAVDLTTAESAKASTKRQSWSGWRPLAIAASLLLVAETSWIALSPELGSDLAGALNGTSAEQPSGTADRRARGFTVGSAPGSSTVALIEVRFVPSAPITEISRLLEELGGSISSGPDAMGRYRLTFGAEAVAQQSMQQKLAVLRSRIDLVRAAATVP
ncbi:MAG: hypothetical protein AAGG06_18970 [Pseudomonadota bacterium]